MAAPSVTILGRAAGSGVTSLAVSTGRVSSGQRIFVAAALDRDGFDSTTDNAGNTYDQVAGAINGVGAFFFECDGNLALPPNGAITLSNSVPFSGVIGALLASGLNDGSLGGSSAGEGFSTAPLVGLDNVPANNWCFALAVTAGPSSDGFIQDPTWSSPAIFNSQQTTTFSVYAAFLHAVSGGNVVWQPTLGIARAWVAMMVSLAP